MLSLFAIFILLLLAAFFSAAETGLTAASRSRLFQLAAEGNKRAKIAQRLREHSEALISAVLLGNNAANTAASAIATAAALTFWGDSGVVYATLAMTILIFVFSEVLPKSYAMKRAESVALFVAPIMRVVVMALTPVNVAIKGVIENFFKLCGLDKPDADENSVHEDLRGAIDMHHQEGQMHRHDRDMLGGILELEDMTVEDAMIHRMQVEALDLDEPPLEIIRKAIASNHSRLPMYRGDFQHVVGIIHIKNLVRLIEQKSRAGITTEDLERISSKPWFVPSTTSLKEQLHAFRQQRQHFALVVDEYGTTLGIVTLEDVIEEIVGEIDDEYDTIDLSNIVQAEEGVWLVDGDVGIRDLNRYLNWDLSDEDANTLAGLVIHHARDIPELGAVFTIQDMRFTVEARTASQVTRLRVEPLRAESAENSAENAE